MRHEREAAEVHAQVTDFCGSTRTKFVDPEFPPNTRSLFLNGRDWSVDGTRHRSSRLPHLTWLRPEEIASPDDGLSRNIRSFGALFGAVAGGGGGGQWEVVRDDVSPEDIRQQVRRVYLVYSHASNTRHALSILTTLTTHLRLTHDTPTTRLPHFLRF